MQPDRTIEEIEVELRVINTIRERLHQELASARANASSNKLKRTTSSDSTNSSTVCTKELKVGSRVVITNRVTPFFRKSNSKDQTSTIRKIVGDKIFLITDNEAKTWRLKKNIKPLNE